jgi:opacity protein-like surface antigen
VSIDRSKFLNRPEKRGIGVAVSDDEVKAMRRIIVGAVALSAIVLLPSVARAQNGQIQGFGGLTFGSVTGSSAFGGSVAVPLTDHIQAFGEGGRMTDLTPWMVGGLLDFTPVDMRISAWYGQAGVRVLGSSGRAVRPYAEATAGLARLSTGRSGFGYATPYINGALGLMGKTEPMLGLGGGVMLQGGPILLDLGYRHHKILSGNSLQSLLTGGDVSVNQVRVGVGVRF